MVETITARQKPTLKPPKVTDAHQELIEVAMCATSECQGATDSLRTDS